MGFGAAVRAKRKERGLTLEQLSERTRITPNYLGRVENGKADPSLSVVIAIARALKVRVGDLLDGSADQPETPSTKRRHAKPARHSGEEMAGILAALPLDVQETLEPALRAIAKRLSGRRHSAGKK